MSRPLLVIVVAYGGAELLERALRPLRHPVMVVDNSSSIAVADCAREHGAEYLDTGSNLGFGAGVNIGAEHARHQHPGADLMLLNPDAVLSAQSLARLHEELQRLPRTAAVAARLTHGDREQRAGWPWPSPSRMWREALGLLGSSRDDEQWFVGAALLLSREAYDEVGPFDEQFFLYGEETDWQRRAVQGGWSVRPCPDVVAEHLGAGTSTDPDRREALFHAGQETYIRKWFGARGWLSYRVAALVGAILRSPLPGDRGAGARRRALLYLRGPRRVAGLGG